MSLFCCVYKRYVYCDVLSMKLDNFLGKNNVQFLIKNSSLPKNLIIICAFSKLIFLLVDALVNSC